MRFLALLFMGMCGPGGDPVDPVDTGDAPWVDGVYVGEAFMEVPFWDWDTCDGPLELTIDADGAVTGESLCVNGEYGTPYPLSFTGHVDADEHVSGEVLLAYTYEDGSSGEYTDPFDGEVAGGAIAFSWNTHVTDDPERPGIILDGYGDASRE